MAITNGNKKKAAQLGMPYGTANHRLRKMLLFAYAVNTGENLCFRCRKPIDSLGEFSIDHIAPWLDSENPKELFFDVGNIAYSHRSCNSASVRPHNKKYFTEAERQEALKEYDRTYNAKTYSVEKRRAQYQRTGK